MSSFTSLSSPHFFSTSFLSSKQSSIPTNTHFLHRFRHPNPPHQLTQFHSFNIKSLQNNAAQSSDAFVPKNPTPRTLFPGGYKRPEIKIPNIVLQLNASEVLNDGSVVDFVDMAVSKWVGIVVVNGDEGRSGGKLYEAACLLKSVIRDRAYLLVAERVDIAVAVNASGVLLSDQGLPPIVARNTLMSSKSDSVVLPVVGKIVQTVKAALNASSAEGADFLIYSILAEEPAENFMNSINNNVKIPVFVEVELITNGGSIDEVSKVLMSSASGVVTSLQELKSSGDGLSRILYDPSATNRLATDIRRQDEDLSFNKHMLNTTNGFSVDMGIASFVNLEDREMQFIKKERRLLMEAVDTIEKAAPLMEEISLLNDAISQLDEPFLLVIVGEFNSGKSSVINALLGGKFVMEGVVPTTNEITFLRYADLDAKEEQRCVRLPDGQNICYLPAKILKKMVIVDTPGTNVILQRQQRLTEEFVPRADLLLFVLSADRPLSESEIAFLRYTQQWKKKVLFLLNKADLYRNGNELDEAITFVRDNVRNLLNVENVTLFPVSARSALEAKLASTDGTVQQNLLMSESYSSSKTFDEFEKFLYDFMDGSTTAGLERMTIKLQTPLAIAERLLSACQTLVTQDCRYAQKDLISVKELVRSVEEYGMKMENESNSWRRQIFSLVGSAKERMLKLVESTLQLSNLDIAFSMFLGGDKSASAATQSIQNDIVNPALADAQRILREYMSWLRENNMREGMQYKETFEKRWSVLFDKHHKGDFTSNLLLREVDTQSLKSIEKFSGTAASKLFDQEVRQVFFGAFGGLGAAGLSASLLTSVLPTTLEDLLALGLCSAGGLLAISNFPARRQKVLDSVKNIADVVEKEIVDAMQKDLSTTVKNMEDFVSLVGKPYEEAAQQRLHKLLETREQLTVVEKKLQTLQVELQNLHLS
ncbi:probable transmembrane GTPase FZO-like, chloroplastic isoform X2 [Chenopodium quinoa]|uniref:probable transmembrane GTPase FZO-like, chloroplastic isoform X2 n=1 Tax=Chenopodium quinoa TaxID=63459 RepID=UPI000B78E293|nr:probable transmembrane GTPase FZO-like, chloroplastic isoform X2 [Chenopodium quinoa]